jgi:hypothetical protein
MPPIVTGLLGLITVTKMSLLAVEIQGNRTKSGEVEIRSKLLADKRFC